MLPLIFWRINFIKLMNLELRMTWRDHEVLDLELGSIYS